MDKISEHSPARQLLSKEPKYVSILSSPSYRDTHHSRSRIEANFKRHPESVTPSSKVKLVRYQQNPTPNWGPGAKPSGKRKRNDDD